MVEWHKRLCMVLLEACSTGLQSVRERRHAIVALWGAAAFVIVSYYHVPCMPGLLEPIGSWQRANGWRASFILCATFCGFIPYMVYLIRRESKMRSPFVMASALAVWCGVSGIACGWFFALQGRWFGNGHDVLTVMTKVVVDQLCWSVLVIVPANSFFYAVLSGGWRINDVRVRVLAPPFAHRHAG